MEEAIPEKDPEIGKEQSGYEDRFQEIDQLAHGFLFFADWIC
jgi:hypothetical protein